MTRLHGSSAARGSALLLVMLLLLVMSVVAASAVTLSSQERINAAAQSSYDALVECATAAQALLWSKVSVEGKSYYTQPSTTMRVESLQLRDGRDLMAPAHLDADLSRSHPADAITTAYVGNPAGSQPDYDVTNTFVPGGGAGSDAGTWVTARCRDASGRLHEVEFAFRFSL